MHNLNLSYTFNEAQNKYTYRPTVNALSQEHTKYQHRKIVVTGGAGYIGSHICVELLLNGYDVVVIDNFTNSSPSIIEKIVQLGQRELVVYNCDIRDLTAMRKVFATEGSFFCVVHLAALKAIGESVIMPSTYYDVNVHGSINLLLTMAEYDCKRIVFSSSASVYGEASKSPIKETAPLCPASPYGRTKLMVEDILRDQCNADPEWCAAILRYFNPGGAHPSGLLTENAQHEPSNLIPYITNVATGKLPHLNIFGNDYPTVDGTGVRDYLHVMDLSSGHLAAIAAFDKGLTGAECFNLGTGLGVSVLQMVNACEQVLNTRVACVICPRRPGDVAECYADASKANERLGWRARRPLKDIYQSTYTNTSDCTEASVVNQVNT